MGTDTKPLVGNITFEATGIPKEPSKPRGRPKGSKNKDKASNGPVDITTTNWAPSVWTVPTLDNIHVKLASEHVEGGLDSIIKCHVIVGVSALPNGMASIITNIGVQQPFILVTAEPYVEVVKRLFPGEK